MYIYIYIYIYIHIYIYIYITSYHWYEGRACRDPDERAPTARSPMEWEAPTPTPENFANWRF